MTTNRGGDRPIFQFSITPRRLRLTLDIPFVGSVRAAVIAISGYVFAAIQRHIGL
jgi:hypothetical protein